MIDGSARKEGADRGQHWLGKGAETPDPPGISAGYEGKAPQQSDSRLPCRAELILKPASIAQHESLREIARFAGQTPHEEARRERARQDSNL
jgi:hypothetical protein